MSKRCNYADAASCNKLSKVIGNAVKLYIFHLDLG